MFGCRAHLIHFTSAGDGRLYSGGQPPQSYAFLSFIFFFLTQMIVYIEELDTITVLLKQIK